MSTAINFPDNPIVNETYPYLDIVYKWDGKFWNVFNPSKSSTPIEGDEGVSTVLGNIDGGNTTSIYTIDQIINGGNA